MTDIEMKEIRKKIESLRPTAEDQFAFSENEELAKHTDRIYKFAVNETIDRIIEILKN